MILRAPQYAWKGLYINTYLGHAGMKLLWNMLPESQLVLHDKLS